MILIKVEKLVDIKIAKKAARHFGCRLYRSLPNAQQFESSFSNIVSARHLIDFFQKHGYQVSRQTVNIS